jgi:hypothetical protein
MTHSHDVCFAKDSSSGKCYSGFAMTKVQLRYDLMRPMDETMMEQVARLHGVYGMVRVRPNDTLDKLIVDYDASRMSESEVENVLQKAGLPIVLHV